MRLAEAQAKERRATSNEGSFQTQFEADREASVEADSKKLAAITELWFPTSKRGMQSFLGALNY
ncbi:hypothetical protein PC110_g23882, partial [Phytophthora cactorum]